MTITSSVICCYMICSDQLASVQVIETACASAMGNLVNFDASIRATGRAVVRITSSILISASKLELGVNFGVQGFEARTADFRGTSNIYG